MKRQSIFFLFAIFATVLTSCTSTREAANGRTFEDDEVYLSPKRTFITETVTETEPTAAQSSGEEDYYDPNATTESKLDMWNRSPYSYTSPVYGSFGQWNPQFYNVSWGWSPYAGWGFGTGNTFGVNYNCWNNWYGWGSGWNTNYPYGFANNNWGWNSPYAYQGWGINSPYFGWNNYGWNNTYYNWLASGGADQGVSTNVTYGHRRPIASNSTYNSSSSADATRRDTPRSVPSSSTGSGNGTGQKEPSFKPNRQISTGSSGVSKPDSSPVATPAGGINPNTTNQESRGGKSHWSMPANTSSSPSRGGSGRVRSSSSERTLDWGSPSVPATRSGGSGSGGGSRSGGSGGSSGGHRR